MFKIQKTKYIIYALIDASSWWEWRDRIFNQNPDNASRIFLEELFSNW